MKNLSPLRPLAALALGALFAAPAAAVEVTLPQPKTGTAKTPWVLELLGKDGKPVQGVKAEGKDYDLSAYAEQLKKAYPELKLDALPAAWKKDALAKDPMFQQISALPGQKSIVLQDGVPVGIKFKHQGKDYVYRPPEKFAFPTALAGEAAVLAVKPAANGGQPGLEVKKFSQLSQEEKKAAEASKAGLEAWRKAGIDLSSLAKAFENQDVTGAGPGVVTVPPKEPGTPAGDFKAPPNEFTTLNAYGTEPPGLGTPIKKGDLVWQGKHLMEVTEVLPDGGCKTSEVGYMAAMQDPAHKGTVIFWHGGDAPDKDGKPKDKEAKSWSLFSVEQGKTSAKGMGSYYAFNLGQGKTVATEEGQRLELSTALDSKEVYRKDEKGELKKAEQKQPLFAYGKPEKGLQRYYGVDGIVYQDQQVDGEKRIVQVGRLHEPPAVTAPAQQPAAPREDPQPAPGQPGVGTTQPVQPGPPSPVGGDQRDPGSKPGQSIYAVSLANKVLSNKKYTPEYKDIENMLLGLDAQGVTPAQRKSIVEALVQGFKRNEGYIYNGSELNGLGDKIRARLAADLGKAEKLEGQDYNALQAMAKGLVDMKAASQIQGLLGAGGSAGTRKVTLARVLMADEARKAGLEREGVRAACADILEPANRDLMKGLLGEETAKTFQLYAAKGLVSTYGVQELARLAAADKSLLGVAVGAVSAHSDYIPGARWLWWRDPPADRTAALNILKAAIKSGDAGLKAQAQATAKLLKFDPKELS